MPWDGADIYVNPTGRFVVGGPMGDTGLTGRKIIVDTYGGYGRHGGGAFSGKDCTKVDRSAAYAARWVAKNVVAAGLATAAKSRLPTPSAFRALSIMVDTFGTAHVAEDKIVEAVEKTFDLRPGASSATWTCVVPSTEDGSLRSLRPRRPRLHLGEDRQGRRTQSSLRPVS